MGTFFEMFVTEILPLVSQFKMATPVLKAICMVNCLIFFFMLEHNHKVNTQNG